MTSGAWGKRGRPLKPKEGLNGPPKILVAGVASFVIHLSTRLRESAAREDNGKGDGSMESSYRTEGVHHLGRPRRPIMRFMKFLIFAVLAALVAAAQSTGQSGPWELEDSGSTAGLRGVHAVGGGVVWASGTGGTILRSEDTGYLWQQCATPPGRGQAGLPRHLGVGRAKCFGFVERAGRPVAPL